MISALDKTQWKSVIKNAVIGGVSAGLIIWQESGFSVNKSALMAAAAAALTAAFKIVEKLFTPVV